MRKLVLSICILGLLTPLVQAQVSKTVNGSTNGNLTNVNQTGSTKQVQIDGIVLENEDIKAVFSKKTGALLELTGKNNSWQFQKNPELGLSFQLLVPLPEKRNNPVMGIKQNLKNYKLSDDKKTLNFYWEKLQSERGGILNINVVGKIRLDSSGLSFTLQIENKSPFTVEAAAYPAIGDLNRPDTKTTLECMQVGYSGLAKSGLSPIFPNTKGYYGVNYPTLVVNMNDQFVLIGTPSNGFYFGCHDTSFKEMITFNFELKPGFGLSHGDSRGEYPTIEQSGNEIPRVELRIWHFSFVNPSESLTLSPIVIKPYQGAWQNGVDVYKDWRKTWFKYPVTPQWAKEVHAWQQIHINSPEDELSCQYKDLVKYGEDCAANGVKAIQLVGWNNGGQDRGNPSHDTDPRLGTWQQLKDAIAKIEAMGVHVILFNKYTWADRSSGWFRDELIKYAVKDPYGDYHVYPGYQYQTPTQLADINTRRLIPMCQNSAAWRSIADKEFKKSIDLGASGMLYDECQHHGGATYCWDKSHGHHVPAYVFSGDIPLVNGFREITKKLNPDYLFAGEANYDLQNTQYSVAYFRLDPFNHIPVKRYIDPWGLIMLQITGFDDRVMINACLKYRYIMSYEPYNFKGRITDFPLTLAYGKKMDLLREKYKEYLWDGEFRDVLGAKVTSDGKPFDSYSVFKHSTDSKHAVVITNNEKKEIEVVVKIDNYNNKMVYVSPENMNEHSFDNKVKIPPLSVVIVMEK